ncbi:MAG: hypothetical protein GF307_05940 [candidate division Zixibacteria bacterium]|nr:hypothetical protein [candidate division Zixibacteria bacterium]
MPALVIRSNPGIRVLIRLGFFQTVMLMCDFLLRSKIRSLFVMPLIFLMVLSPVAGNISMAQQPDIDMSQLQLPQSRKLNIEADALESPVDPTDYYVGPGDVLSINIWGEMAVEYQLNITPEATVLIPTVGEVDLRGLSLKDAKQKIKSAVLNRYRDTGISITLLKLRSFRVSIVGAVFMPGVYSMNANDRVSSLIEEAGGLIGYIDPETGQKLTEYVKEEEDGRKKAQEDKQQTQTEKKIKYSKASKRNIELIRRTGERILVDILKYERAGYLESNPRLLDGDVVVVPVIEDDINKYGIFGAVKYPGFCEYYPGDRVSDLIHIAHGLTLNADLTSGELVRFASDKVSTYSIELDIPGIMANESGPASLLLRPDDRVFIKSIEPYHEKKQVKIKGEVYYPGTYWIESDSIMLSELLRRSGGPTGEAYLQNAQMIRESAEATDDPEYERLKRMQVSDMTETEYEYFKMRERETPGEVSLNLQALLINGDRSFDIPLRSGDIIEIPKKSLTISVTGEVLNPGLIPFVEGEDVDYYIGKAGGFSQEARKGKIRIIQGSTGEWVKPGRKHPLKPGDTVWVPEKPDRDYWKIFRETLAVAGNLATIYLVIKQATD